MAVTGTLYGATAANVTGTWSPLSNAQGSGAGTFATASDSAANTSLAMQVGGFDVSSIPAGSTINSVSCQIRWSANNVGGSAIFFAPFSAGLYVATTLKQNQAITAALSSGTTTSFSATNITYADLASLNLRFTGVNSNNAGLSRTYGVDWASIVVDYTAPVANTRGFMAFF